MRNTSRERVALPKEESLADIGLNGACLEHRDGKSLIWSDDWWDGGQPYAVLLGHLTRQEARFWYEGYLAGKKEGEADGRRDGFADCQAGFRALLGAASASDVNRLLRAAAEED